MAVVQQLANNRQGTQKAKTRSEVSGGGRKPWRQKGTGHARQGSIRAPQWKGGGVVFAPVPRDYSFKLNKKEKRAALKSVLTDKVLNGNLVVVDELKLDEIKTKKAVALMNAFKFDRKTLFVADAAEDFDNAYVSMRNIPNATLVTVPMLNVYDIANADRVVFTEAAAAKAGEVFAE